MSNKLQAYISGNAPINQLSVDELENTIIQYPYFYSPRVLLSKIYKQNDSLKFNKTLTTTALYSNNRAALMHFLEPDDFTTQEPVEMELKYSSDQNVAVENNNLTNSIDNKDEIENTANPVMEERIILESKPQINISNSESIQADEPEIESQKITIEMNPMPETNMNSELQGLIIENINQDYFNKIEHTEVEAPLTVPTTNKSHLINEIDLSGLSNKNSTIESNTETSHIENIDIKNNESIMPMTNDADSSEVSESVAISKEAAKNDFNNWLKLFNKGPQSASSNALKETKPVSQKWNQFKEVMDTVDAENEQDMNDVEDMDVDIVEMATFGLKKHDDFVTETMAQIYISQQKYDKAIETFQKLSLLKPQKSTLFAAEIEKIKNLNK